MSSSTPHIYLKPGRERSVIKRHPWIFSGAVQNSHAIVDGAVHSVYSSNSDFLGLAYFNSRCSLIGRMISYQNEDPKVAIRRSLEDSIRIRQAMMPQNEKEMYRLVHGEADFLPGLIVDRFYDVAVLQIGTLGMEAFRDIIIETLTEKLPLTWIYERSSSSSRKLEGLSSFEKTVWGQERDEVVADENGIHFSIDVRHGQKTGFFLDQREMRKLIRSLAKEKRVLNCFCYSGGFSLASLLGEAQSCLSIDVSDSALALLEHNLELNELRNDARHETLREDVFNFIRASNRLDFDLIILDPPAFAKKPKDVTQAIRGYREINSQVMKKMGKGLLLTCSCSHFVSSDQFVEMLKEAALMAQRQVRMLSTHHNSFDHPLSLTHPESEYLKSYLLHIE